MDTLLTLRLQTDLDVVFARQRAGQIAALLDFDTQDQTRIATATSEVARDAFQRSGTGSVVFGLERGSPALFRIDIKDPDTKEASGAVEALAGARRVMDQFRREITSKGSVISLGKVLPVRTQLDEKSLARIGGELTRLIPNGVLDEMQQHNQEMLGAMEELQNQKQQLLVLNRELEDTNRGVVALYAELDERAELLVKSNEIKTRFLSNTSHELRTPLNAILSLTSLLLGRADGDLTEEQERQVKFIRSSTQTLADLVNDLLDLARVESGKVVVRPESFEVADLFGALRGTLKPLLPEGGKVNLVFEETADLPALFTDEGKVSQVLRNFISNALKFTSVGEVKVWAAMGSDGCVIFCVEDSGIGISRENLDYIFEEFSQVDTPLQRRSKGTGLGLPLARKLAQLLGGEVSVESEVGVGSKFYFTLPSQYAGEVEVDFSQETAPAAKSVQTAVTPELPTTRGGILIIDNESAHRYVLKARLLEFGRAILEAENGKTGLEIAKSNRPELIFLDLVMPGMDGFRVLEELRGDPLTQDIPTVVHTSKRLTEAEERALAASASALIQKDLPEAEMVEQLRQVWKRVEAESSPNSSARS